MRIAENSPERLTLRDRSWWFSVPCFATSAILLGVSVAKGEHWSRLASDGIFAVFGLATLRATEVTFDRDGRTCEVRRFNVIRRKHTLLAFSDIHDIKVEIDPSQDDPEPNLCRLVLVTASGALPLTASYRPGPKRYHAMRDMIIDVLAADTPGPVIRRGREGG